jgi:hypothetical protein
LSLSSLIWVILRARDLWAASRFFSRLRETTTSNSKFHQLSCNVAVSYDAEAHARTNARDTRACIPRSFTTPRTMQSMTTQTAHAQQKYHLGRSVTAQINASLA